MLPSPTSKYSCSLDKISSLPRPIIHGILSLLPARDATRTSILSKTFYSNWTSFPVIDLNFYLVTRSTIWSSSKRSEFIDYLNRTLRRRRLETDLEKFSLRFPLPKYLGDDEVNYTIFANSIIKFSIANRVKELSIDFPGTRVHPPPITIEDASCITMLNLVGVILPNFNDPLLDWSRLVNLRIWNCSGFHTFKFSNSKIRSIVLGSFRGLNSVTIESPSLEHFECCYLEGKVLIDISKCQNLKELRLISFGINEDWISDNIPTFSKLEKLELIRCCLGNPKIWNDNVRKMELCLNYNPKRIIEITARNLQSLSFTMDGPCKIGIGSCMHVRELCFRVRGHGHYFYIADEIWVEKFLDEFLKEQVAKLNELERLDLSVNTSLNSMEIRHKQLKRLALHLTNDGGSHWLGEVVVDTPKIVSHIYSKALATVAENSRAEQL